MLNHVRTKNERKNYNIGLIFIKNFHTLFIMEFCTEFWIHCVEDVISLNYELLALLNFFYLLHPSPISGNLKTLFVQSF